MEKDESSRSENGSKKKSPITEEAEPTNGAVGGPQASTSRGSTDCSRQCQCCQNCRGKTQLLGTPSTVLDVVTKLSPEQSTLMYLWAKKRAQTEQKRTQSLRARKSSRAGDNARPRRASIEVLYSPTKRSEDEIKPEESPATGQDAALGDLELQLDSWENMMYVFSRYYQDNLNHLIVQEEDLESEDAPSPPPYPVGNECTAMCQVCLTVYQLHLRVCCQMAVCDGCLQQYFSLSVSEGVVKVQCPNPECTKFIDRDEIMARLPVEQKDKFYKFLIDANKDPLVKTCPYCSHITHLPKEHHDELGNKFGIKLDCELCHLTWCFPCQAPYHKDITCKEFRKGDKLLKNWAKKYHRGQPNAQKCPKCKVFIQRITGCDHMVCSHCDTNFCYRCGDRYRKLKFIGDHYTRLSIFGCKYRFKPHQPVLRKLIRGSIFGAKIIAAPVLGVGVLAAGAVILALAGTFVLPCLLPKFAYKRYQFRKQRRLRREQHATLRARLEALGRQAEELEISMPQSHTYHDSVEEDSDSIMTVSNFSDAPPTELYADILTHWHGEDDTEVKGQGQEEVTSDPEVAEDVTLTSENANGDTKGDVRTSSQDAISKSDEESKLAKQDHEGGKTEGESGHKSDTASAKSDKPYFETDIDSCVLDKDCSKMDLDNSKAKTGSVKAEKTNSKMEKEYATTKSEKDNTKANQDLKLEAKSDSTVSKPEKEASKTEKDNQKVDKESKLKEEIVKVNCTKFFLKLGLVDSESTESVNADVVDDFKRQISEGSKMDNQNMKELTTIHTNSYITSL